MSEQAYSIVGVGASAGGLEAFRSFFQHMPANCGMAFVMILHLPAHRKSMLTDILGRWTTMRVISASHGQTVEANCVYIPPPHTIVTLANGRLDIRQPTDDEKLFRPIDAFFDSLGSSLREQAVGIVLSGTGSDGALGLKAIKECGGLTIAQGIDGTAPQYGEMPAGAIATGSIDLVAPVEDIPGHLVRMLGTRSAALLAPDPSADTDRARLEICDILRSQLGHDFSGYRDKTFLRRVERRMQVVGVATLQDYIARLKIDHEEVVLLFRDLLIRVTSFFRDQDTFEALESKVIPKLFDGKAADDSVRVWVPGCATGEEAYSLAILLREHMDTMKGAPKAQVFATDIDESAIATARLGRYPRTLVEGLSLPRLERYFKESLGSFVVTKEIRDLCTFSAHNLVRDPPFSRMNLVSCRNLLIYMDTQLQSTVIPVFHYALVRGGILLLGGSESAAQHKDLFEPLDKAARIFERRDVRSPTLNLGLQTSNGPGERVRANQALPPTLGEHAIEAVSTRSGPASFGRGARLDDPARGHRSPPLRTGTPSLPPRTGVGELLSRLKNVQHVLFPKAGALNVLQRDLLSTQEELQSLAEEHQTALEELRSTNEELHSVNEEMQSTNEELETSKEELQSLNEELHTVNMRLTEKVDELAETNSDLRNLFESTEIATVFLDRHLVIRSFTPAIGSLYNLIPSDAGRPLGDIAGRLDYDHMNEDVAQVLSSLQPLERRIARKDGTVHYIMRILPYREPDSTVSGVLVTFVDVTSIVQAEAALVAADVRKDVFLATLSHELRNPLAPIRTAARLLELPMISPEQLVHAQAVIARQVSHMSSLLDDLLDVSRITRGAFLLKKEYVDVRSLLDAAVEAVQPAIDAKLHTLRLERLTSPLMLKVDPVRLTQVISNLLTNAAKYTPAGGLISLGVVRDAEAVSIVVRDNGQGLAPEVIGTVFNMFTQIDSDVDRTEGGLGIGLALSKGLIELHGGRIDARSAGLGHGSEFKIVLPNGVVVTTSRAAAVQSSSNRQQVSRRVLVADDNLDGAQTMGMLLECSGHEVYLAHTGAEALEIAKRMRPDIGVLDIGMPDMSGFDVASRIRLEAWGTQITLIAVTGWGQADDKRRALAAGFDHHLTKPVDPERLEELFVKPRANHPDGAAI